MNPIPRDAWDQPVRTEFTADVIERLEADNARLREERDRLNLHLTRLQVRIALLEKQELRGSIALSFLGVSTVESR